MKTSRTEPRSRGGVAAVGEQHRPGKKSGLIGSNAGAAQAGWRAVTGPPRPAEDRARGVVAQDDHALGGVVPYDFALGAAGPLRTGRGLRHPRAGGTRAVSVTACSSIPKGRPRWRTQARWRQPSSGDGRGDSIHVVEHRRGRTAVAPSALQDRIHRQVEPGEEALEVGGHRHAAHRVIGRTLMSNIEVRRPVRCGLRGVGGLAGGTSIS